MIHSLKARLTLWYTLLLAVTSLIFFFVIYLVLVRNLNDRLDNNLYDDAKEIVLLFERFGFERAAQEIALEVQGEERQVRFYRIFSPAAQLISATDLSAWQHLAAQPEYRPEPGQMVFSSLPVAGHHYPVRSVFYGMKNGYFLQVGMEPINNESLFSLFRETFAVAFVSLVVVGAICGFLILLMALKGLTGLQASFERVGYGEFSHLPISDREPAEIKTLIQTFNNMQQRIQTLIAELRNVTNNIAHDLRSPITRIRGMAETTLTGPQTLEEYQETTGSIIEDCDTLVGMINTMLEIAESDAGVTRIAQVIVDISGMIHDAADIFLPVAEDKGVELLVRCPPYPVYTTGDKVKLQRALANLVDNALKYTPSGGGVTLALDQVGNALIITLCDTGIGIAEGDLEHIFDRFYRCDPSRSTPGNGLGLALVRAIVRLHRGQIEVSSTLGKGSCFKLTLPATQA